MAGIPAAVVQLLIGGPEQGQALVAHDRSDGVLFTGSAQVGHSDRIGHNNQSWNSSHGTTSCSQRDFQSWGGDGLFYCFATD